MGLNELANEKDKILKEEMEKINEEYDKKRKDFETKMKMYICCTIHVLENAQQR